MKRFVLFFSALCLCCCSKGEFSKDSIIDSDVHRVSFSTVFQCDEIDDVSGVDNTGLPSVKASPVVNLSTYGSFCLNGYLYDTWSNSVLPDYMTSEKVSLVNSRWTTENSFNVKLGTRKLRFYGYAPIDAQGILVPQKQSGPLTFSYTLPSDISKQKDILVCSSQEYSGELVTPSLSFRHCLSAVTFKTGIESFDGTICSIRLNNVYTKANYNLESGWSGYSDLGDVSYISNIPVTSGTEKTLTSDETTMMLIPQTVPDKSSLEVIVKYEGKTDTLSADISGDVWKEGKQCVYSFSFLSLMEYTVYYIFSNSCGYTIDIYDSKRNFVSSLKSNTTGKSVTYKGILDNPMNPDEDYYIKVTRVFGSTQAKLLSYTGQKLADVSSSSGSGELGPFKGSKLLYKSGNTYKLSLTLEAK